MPGERTGVLPSKSRTRQFRILNPLRLRSLRAVQLLVQTAVQANGTGRVYGRIVSGRPSRRAYLSQCCSLQKI
jgi:hypothetical protein